MQVILISSQAEPLAERSRRNPDALYVSPASRLIARGGVVLSVPGRLAYQIVVALVVRRGAPVSTEQLIDLLWGDRADGGPDASEKIIREHVWRLRHVLIALGVRVDATYARGLRAVDCGAVQDPRA